MRIRSLTIAAIFAGLGSACAQSEVPPDALRAVKAATVHVKTDRSRGTGILIRLQGEHAIVATAAGLGDIRYGVTVVFSVGEKDAANITAEVAAADNELGVVLLRMKSPGKLPKPIEMTVKPALAEKTKLYLAGCAAEAPKDGPAISLETVTPAGGPKEGLAFTLERGIPAGFAGGPVIDARGRFVGIATTVNQGDRGSVVTAAELTRMMLPSATEVSVKVVKAKAGTVDAEIQFKIIDPALRVTKAWARFIRKDAVKVPIAMNKEGSWPALGDATSATALTVEQLVAVGTTTVRHNSTDKQPVDFLMQPVIATIDGKTLGMQPTAIRIDFAKGSIERTDKPATAVATGDMPIGKLTPVPKSTAAPGKLNLVGISDTPEPKPVAEIKKTSKTIGAEGDAPACMCWADDKGSAFYHLDAAGSVRRLTFPDLTEDAILETGKQCSWLCMAAGGPVLTVAKDEEAWVLDGKTLKPKAKIKLPGITRVVAVPKSPFAIACCGNPYEGAGFTVDQQKVRKYEGGGIKFVAAILPTDTAASPDGKAVFLPFGSTLVKLHVKGMSFEHVDEHRLVIRGALQGFCFSADGDYMCAPAEGGNTLNGVPAEWNEYHTYVFASKNLKEPVLKLETGMYPHAIGFDNKSGLIYAQSLRQWLIVYDTKGTKLKEFRLGERVGDPKRTVRQFLVHPDGRKLVVLVSGKPTFPKDGPKLPSEVFAVELVESN
jgi:hypothetical protein